MTRAAEKLTIRQCMLLQINLLPEATCNTPGGFMGQESSLCFMQKLLVCLCTLSFVARPLTASPESDVLCAWLEGQISQWGTKCAETIVDKCEFDGVTCTVEGIFPYTTDIDVKGRGLTGTLPNDLTVLQYLETL